MIDLSAREGAAMRSRTLCFTFSLLLLLAAAAEAKSYSADRFDARIQVLSGGDIHVIETVVFRFNGSFSEVFRRIPRSRTDGIEVLGASMDGVPLVKGSGPGQYDLSDHKGMQVRWHFRATGTSVHTFELTYRARGVVQQTAAGDLFEWQAQPSEHDYRIASSTIDIDLPAAPAAAPELETRRTASARVGRDDSHVTIRASTIRSNGWVEASILLPAGSTIATAPAWQARRRHAAELAPGWLTAAGIVFVAGLVVLFAIRQGYDSPVREGPIGPTGPDLPDQLPPAVAGALVSNGRVGLEQAMATLFTLAERGELTITEKPARWGQRQFVLERTPTSRDLSDSEHAVLDATFSSRQPDRATDLSRARGRLARRIRPFSRAVTRQMAADGFIDEDRLAVRNRYVRVGIVALLVGAIGMIPAAIFVDSFGPWPLLVPAAVMVLGIIAIIMHAAHTPLSNEGIRRARAWRGFQRFVRQVTHDRATVPAGTAERLLPYVVATGMAAGWAAYLKKHGHGVPAWFRGTSGDRGDLAFAYFVGAGGAGPSSGGVSGSGAAGGGASGAH